MILRLPYPPSKLNPNRKVHHMVRARLTKAYRKECGFEALAQGLHRMDGDTLSLTITFHPPDKRRRDRDNAITAFKSGQDAIADVTGIDDSQFAVNYTPGFGEPIPGGCVKVEVTT